PFEGRQFNKRLKKLIAQFDLPPVVFHSIRHTSTTYKLKIAGGDVKLVQGDTGHANSQMVTDVYAEIVDEDRKYNAQRFEQEFYGSPLEASTPAAPAPQQQATVSPQDLAALVSLLQNNPNAVASLLQNAGIQTAV
ncbi:tyrosine-type recombinase/integrase, partial [Ruminococcaceae bacterium OttesenSCG-928-O06]|nr:tyrosine-type recombinase/integrase [Ruminococcaceae bacterium OttesenSCG-928-O06]